MRSLSRLSPPGRVGDSRIPKQLSEHIHNRKKCFVDSLRRAAEASLSAPIPTRTMRQLVTQRSSHISLQSDNQKWGSGPTRASFSFVCQALPTILLEKCFPDLTNMFAKPLAQALEGIFGSVGSRSGRGTFLQKLRITPRSPGFSPGSFLEAVPHSQQPEML